MASIYLSAVKNNNFNTSHLFRSLLCSDASLRAREIFRPAQLPYVFSDLFLLDVLPITVAEQ